ncbi:DMT family transporter [Tepidimicrobium xylanilyticum]|uniref:DMT family transporter n=1 Tax=Tepidimicrobium xylanilyticum TaxID=1123352 RepID=UPI00264E104D|nr:EamA family transporter [Tepidimicrobium xylanilyticum]GMG97614.1 transporter [Tepidimicrobium xylanilyticum]
MNAKLKIIISMVAFGTISIFVRNISLSSGEIAFFRAVIAAIVILIYKALIGSRFSLLDIKKDLPLLFISGAVMGFNWILLFEAYKYTSVSIATLSYYFSPVIVTVLSPVLFKEKMTIKQIICFIMSTIGLVMVIGISGTDKSSANIVGIGFGLGAAVFYAIVILLNKFVTKVSGVDKTLIQLFAAIIVLIPYVLITTGVNIENLGIIGITNILILGIVHTGICYCLYFSSIKDLKGQQVSILSYIDPLVAIVISVAVLNEPISFVQLIGGMMILGFTLLNEVEIKFKL